MQPLAGMEGLLLGRLDLGVVGADVLADVTAEDMIPHERPQLAGDGPLQLDGEIRDALAGIQDVGADEGVGRAGIQAQPALTTPVPDRPVPFQVQTQEQLPQEEERADCHGQEVRVLPVPADPGPRPGLPVQDRPGIHEDAPLDLGPRLRPHVLQQPRELRLHHVVIVVPPGVPGDPAADPLRLRLPAMGSVVIQRDRDDRPGPGQELARMEPLLRRPRHVFHLPVIPAAEPPSEGFAMGGWVDRRDSHQVEAEVRPLGLDPLGQHPRSHTVLGCNGWSVHPTLPAPGIPCQAPCRRTDEPPGRRLHHEVKPCQFYIQKCRFQNTTPGNSIPAVGRVP